MANKVIIFNDRPLCEKAYLIRSYGARLCGFVEDKNFYNFYSLDNNLIMLKFSLVTDRTVDIWMMEYRQFDHFVKSINIDDVWERVTR